MGEALTATLSDGDTPTSAADIKWQWYRGSTKIIGATGAGATTNVYMPVQADVGEMLTAKATYTDGKNSNKDMASATTIMAVRLAPSSNNAPTFPDQNPDLIAPMLVTEDPQAEGGGEHPCGDGHR